ACLQRRELEALHLRAERRALESSDRLVESSAALERRPRQPSGKVHGVLRPELAEVGREALQLAIDGTRVWHVQGPPGGSAPQRGSKNQVSGSHSSRAYGSGRSSTSTSHPSNRPTIANRSRSCSTSSGRNRARILNDSPAPTSR